MMLLEPKAVIFDYGNVLCAPQQASDLQVMADVLRLPEAEFLPLYWRERIDYDAAKLDGRAFWRTASPNVSEAQIKELIRLDVASWMRPNPVMLDWARKLSEAGVRTAVLSNMPLDLREFLTGHVDWMPAFDHMTYSCDVRLCKPDAAIYEVCLRGIGVPAGEALFLDDREDNVEAARRVGLHALLFTTAAEVVPALKAAYRLPVWPGV